MNAGVEPGVMVAYQTSALRREDASPEVLAREVRDNVLYLEAYLERCLRAADWETLRSEVTVAPAPAVAPRPSQMLHVTVRVDLL